MKPRLLLVEDDEALIRIVEQRLREQGYEVVSKRTAEEAESIIGGDPIDLALIDIGLPDGDGFTVAHVLAERTETPFVFLTAMGSPEHRLEAYEIGASDYIPKPFHFRELLLRIEKILGPNRTKKSISSGMITLTPETRMLSIEGREPVQLGEREFTLLYHLLESSPKIVARQEVIDQVWQVPGRGNHRAVDNAVLRLRQILGPELSGALRSVRRAGYQWLSDPDGA